MALTRRRFLGSAAAAAVPILSPLWIPEPHSADWVENARRQIPATRDRFFQTAGIAPSPMTVMDRVASVLRFQNSGPVHPEVSPEVGATEPKLRAHIARMFGAHEDEVALTHSTSEGINIASWALNWRAGDEVIISNQEHPANTIPWYNLATRFEIRVRRIDTTTGTDLIHEVRQALSDRTRMVSIPHVSRNNGRRVTDSESAELAALLRGRGVRYHLDGAQGPGCVSMHFHSLGCDYYSGCGHKWLLGPKGTGMFFSRREVLDLTGLTWTGSHSTVSYDQAGAYELIPAARRFEFGTRALATFAGFQAALEWLEGIGFDRILQRVEELAEYTAASWDGRGYRVSSPTEADRRSGVVVIQLPGGCSGLEIYHQLRNDEATFTSPVDAPQDLRLAVHFFNTRTEIDQTLDLIDRACA